MLLRSTALLRSRWPRQRRSRGSGGRRLVGLMRSCGRATAALWAGGFAPCRSCLHAWRRAANANWPSWPRPSSSRRLRCSVQSYNKQWSRTPMPRLHCTVQSMHEARIAHHTAAPCCPNESSSKPRFGAIILCINRLQNNVSKASLQPSLPDLVAHAQKPSSSCRWPRSHELFARKQRKCPRKVFMWSAIRLLGLASYRMFCSRRPTTTMMGRLPLCCRRGGWH